MIWDAVNLTWHYCNSLAQHSLHSFHRKDKGIRTCKLCDLFCPAWVNETIQWEPCHVVRSNSIKIREGDQTVVGKHFDSYLQGCNWANPLWPIYNGHHFADDTLIRIFLNENGRISNKITLKFVVYDPIKNIPPLVQIMDWRRICELETHGPLTRYIKLQVAHAPGMPGTFFSPPTERKPLMSDPGTHHGACVAHVPWCMSGSLTCCDGENVPSIPGACTALNFAYLARGP